MEGKLPWRENWTRRGLLDLECSGGKASARTSTACGSGGHLSVGSKGRTGQVPAPGTPLGASPCQVLSLEKCQQNFQAGSSTTPHQDCHRPRGTQWSQSLANAGMARQTQELDGPCGSLLSGYSVILLVEILRAITNIQI